MLLLRKASVESGKIEAPAIVCHLWFCMLWGFWHPGSVHRCNPRAHFPPGGASEQPFSKLKAQHNLSPASVWSDLLISPFGTFGPLPFLLEPLRPLPFPCPFALGASGLDGDAFGGVRERVRFGAGLSGFGLLDVLAGKGRR